MNLELKKAIDQISKDKGLDRDMLVDTLEDAVRTSVIRKYGENIDVEVSYNDDTGKSRSTSSRSSLTTWPIPIPKSTSKRPANSILPCSSTTKSASPSR